MGYFILENDQSVNPCMSSGFFYHSSVDRSVSNSRVSRSVAPDLYLHYSPVTPFWRLQIKIG